MQANKCFDNDINAVSATTRMESEQQGRKKQFASSEVIYDEFKVVMQFCVAAQVVSLLPICLVVVHHGSHWQR